MFSLDRANPIIMSSLVHSVGYHFAPSRVPSGWPCVLSACCLRLYGLSYYHTRVFSFSVSAAKSNIKIAGRIWGWPHAAYFPAAGSKTNAPEPTFGADFPVQPWPNFPGNTQRTPIPRVFDNLCSSLCCCVVFWVILGVVLLSCFLCCLVWSSLTAIIEADQHLYVHGNLRV